MKACVGVRKKKMCSLTNADLVVVNLRDVILKITSAAICGSDLHLLQWFDAHDGKRARSCHEPMGEVVAVGSADTKFNSNDSRGCSFRSYAASGSSVTRACSLLCDTSNPNAEVERKAMCQSPPICSPIRICWTHSRRISPEGSRPTILHAI
jgi:threonine dehydrogenase-like Zn-dependent dehydrogenase